MDEEKKDDLATFSSKFEGKQPKWVWNLFAYIQLANDIKGGKMPAEDASKNTIEYVPADFNTYMMILQYHFFFALEEVLSPSKINSGLIFQPVPPVGSALMSSCFLNTFLTGSLFFKSRFWTLVSLFSALYILYIQQRK